MKITIAILTFIVANNLCLAQNIGVGTITPTQKLHVNGKLKVADDGTTPSAGTIRWNTATSDFEGFNGTQWLSLTAGSTSTMGSGNDIGRLKDYTVAGAPSASASEYMGWAVDISGEWAIVTARQESPSGAGHIFRKSGVDWVHFQKITPAVITAGAYFGTSAAIDGNYLIVGAELDGANQYQGAAWVFFYNGSTWVEQQKLVNTGGIADEHFGTSVDISGDMAVVGAPQVDVLSDVDEGRAFAFKRTGTTWNQTGVFTGPSGDAGDYFGNAVAIDGNYLVVGAPFHTVSTLKIGSAVVYIWNGVSWSTQATLQPGDGVAGDLFGISVAISGSNIVVGAREASADFSHSGAAYIFSRSGTLWSQQAKLFAQDGNANAGFGTSVAISGDFCIVGDPDHFRKDACGVNVTSSEGQAYIYKRIGT